MAQKCHCNGSLIEIDCSPVNGQCGCGTISFGIISYSIAWCERNGQILSTVVVVNRGGKVRVLSFADLVSNISQLKLPKVKADTKIQLRAKGMLLSELAALINGLSSYEILAPVTRSNKKVNISLEASFDDVVKALGLTVSSKRSSSQKAGS